MWASQSGLVVGVCIECNLLKGPLQAGTDSRCEVIAVLWSCLFSRRVTLLCVAGCSREMCCCMTQDVMRVPPCNNQKQQARRAVGELLGGTHFGYMASLRCSASMQA